ncbi:OmpA family protein [Pararhodobacter oceanensis]|uniref:OmpA family protein n=1 Tax=Pararhodobacter oceanensis TaxID=2172121 RepID=UPI003A930B3E
MTNKPLIASIAAFVLAVALALIVALLLAAGLERRSAQALAQAFDAADLPWVEVEVDGLQAALSGTAPTESDRIRALRVAGTVVDAARVSDSIEVPVSNAVVTPVFRIEMMRDRSDISVIGLVPGAEGEMPIVEELQAAVPDSEIADMLQSADHAVPAGWERAVDFAVNGLALFDIGRISVSAGRIEVEALVESAEAGERLATRLRGMAPRGQVLTLDLTPPRPVATPFLLRVDLSGGRWQLRACSADTEEAQAQIRNALQAAGMTRSATCPLALGTPSPRWGEAAAATIAALANLGEGNLTISDGDVALIVPHSVAANLFDRAVGRLETALPDAFVLSARRLDPPAEDSTRDDGRAEVTLVLEEDGQIALAGRLPNTRIREAVRSFAQARFGAQSVDMAIRVAEDLPQGWSVRVLTAIEAVAELHHGSALVLADRIEVSGVSGNPDVETQVTQVIVEGLGADTEFTINVEYSEALDPVAQAPTPENCEARVQAILSESKITFDPGSISINAASGRVLDAIAEELRECGELPFEVAGHTDSQGRAQTNQRLSQSRAEAVVNALMTRRVLVASFVARGYGAEFPIADNGTAAGREENRRIEFTLIRPEAEPEPLDPALEAELEFEVSEPGDDTTRPRPRPEGLEVPEEAETGEAGADEAAEAETSGDDAAESE